MAGSLNKVTLIGNLGADPKINLTKDNKEIATLSVATSETWKDRATGEKKERTEWHRVVIFSEALVSVVKAYVKKGSKLYVEGALQTRKWVDNAGVERYSTEIILQNYNSQLLLLDSKGGVASSTDHNMSNAHGFSASSENSQNYNDLDDEIPF